MKVIEAMVRIYANLVRAGRRTIASLPEIYQEPVREYLKEHYPDEDWD